MEEFETEAREFSAKFAFCNEMFGDRPLAEAWEFAAMCGYTGVEIAPFTISRETNYVTELRPSDRNRIRREAESAGLQVVGLHWLLAKTEGLYLTSPDLSIRKKTSLYFGELVRLCADLGGSVMVLGSPVQRNLLPGVTFSEALDYAAKVLDSVLRTLEDHEVTIAIEPLEPKSSDFINTVAEAVQLIELVDSPWVQLQLDVHSMSYESTPIPELIRDHAWMATHFHANDSNLQGPGFGKINFVPILAALKEIDYQGWISVEPFDFSPGPEILAVDSIAYLKECMK
ncbi:MAG: sugar phosphate isomerase/epimerase family protein [Planctomycetia bacterium]|jgi:sugar phosphate isomerase/epimerase